MGLSCSRAISPDYRGGESVSVGCVQERVSVEPEPPELGTRSRARVADAHNVDPMSPPAAGNRHR